MTLASLGVSTVVVFAFAAGCTAAPPAPMKSTVQVNMNFNVQDQPRVRQEFERGAISGVAQRVGFFYSVNPDCSSSGLVTLQLKSRPNHGTVEFIPADGFTNFPASSPSYECNKKKSPGVEVRYTSTQDFVGADHFAVQGIGPYGKYLETAYAVKVLAPR